MHKINSYNELSIWQKSVELVSEVYQVTATLPKQESYGLISQLNRASVSIPCNIAEGWGRESTKSYAAFLKISRGSVMELETLIHIGVRLNLIDKHQANSIRYKTIEMNKMLTSLIKKVKANPLKRDL